MIGEDVCLYLTNRPPQSNQLRVNITYDSYVKLLNVKLIEVMIRQVFKPKNKVLCVFPMVNVSIVPHAEFGRNDHQEDALHFTLRSHLLRMSFENR